MPPPQLAADRPVVDVLHPVGVHLLEARGQDRGPSLGDRCERPLGERLHADEPLHRQARLAHRPAAVASADHHVVRALVLEVARRPQALDDLPPGLVPIEPGELAAGLVHAGLLVEDGDGGQAVALRQVVVVLVVRRRDLHRAGAEGAVHVLVADDRQAPAEERQDRVPADEVAVSLVLRVHGDRGVAEHRLGPRGGDGDPGVGIRRAIGPLEVVADRPDAAGLVVVDVLEVADRREAARAPGHQRLAAVHVAGVPQSLEGDAHRTRAHLVHREALAIPVGARTQPAVLASDDVARLVDEPPHPLEVALPAQRRTALPLLGDDPIEHELRGDARVVDAGHPERVVATHAVVADEGVLDRRRQRVADVQRAGHVRRRLRDHEPGGARRRLGSGPEGTGRLPALVDARLDRRGVVARRQLASARWSSVLSLLKVRPTQSPLVEGRTGSSWYHLRSRPMRPPLVPRYRADPAGSRATFALSLRGGLSAHGTASLCGRWRVTLHGRRRVSSLPPAVIRPAVRGALPSAAGPG